MKNYQYSILILLKNQGCFLVSNSEVLTKKELVKYTNNRLLEDVNSKYAIIHAQIK